MARTSAIFTEFAGIADGRDITRGFIPAQSLEPQDAILLAKGGDYRTYEWVLQDDQVQSCLQQRRLAVVACEWEVEPGGPSRRDRKAAESLKAQLAAIEWDRTTAKMHYGVFYGYAVGECIWARDGAEIVLDRIKVRKQRRFRFDDQGRLRLRLPDHPFDGVPVPDRKFWWFNTGADNDDDPYGLGLAHWLYWPVFFKRNGIKLWLRFLDKFSTPTVVGKHPQGMSEAERQELLRTAMSVSSASAVVVPQDTVLELLEATRSGSVDAGSFHQSMDAAIAKIILSQTMTTDNGSSRSQAEVHAGVAKDVIKSDADLLCQSFNAGPARWLTEWNYPGAAPPRVWRRNDDEPDLKPQADRDAVLFAMGYKPTPDYIRTTYGDGFEPRETGSRPPAQAPLGPGADQPAAVATGDDGRADPSFAEPEETAVRIIAEKLAAVADTQIEVMVAAVRAALDEVERIEDLPERLLALLEGVDTNGLGQVLADALVLAELAGRGEVMDQTRGTP
ncbi:MAG: hypothetical protein RLY86_687 [Pseudomonadota bacterium]|jgi:phage gp29-like protein